MHLNNIFSPYVYNNFVIRLIIAAILGAIIGIERDTHGRAAGVRTNMLVSLGSALFMIISEYIVTSFSGNTSQSIVRADPARIAAQIVTGIGFIGAGAIIKSGFTIRGLTTAACLWISAGIGMSAGTGLYKLAILTTIISLIGLIIFNYAEKLLPKNSYRILEITTSNDINISEIIDTIKRLKIKVLYLDKERDYESNRMILKFNIRVFHRGITDKIVHKVVENIENLDIDLYNIKWFHL